MLVWTNIFMFVRNFLCCITFVFLVYVHIQVSLGRSAVMDFDGNTYLAFI